jgi:hypothetical protein
MNWITFRTLIALCLLASTPRLVPQQTNDTPYYVIQKFSFWASLATPNEKYLFYSGFTNGFFLGAKTKGSGAMYRCLEKDVPIPQATAMIDKYYRDNPQRWNIPMAITIFEALTVKGGPCSDIDVWGE